MFTIFLGSQLFPATYFSFGFSFLTDVHPLVAFIFFIFIFFHVINQPVYYFVVRWITFTMQIDVPISAWTVHVLPKAVTWKTKLLSSYLGVWNPNKGRPILKPTSPSSMKLGHILGTLGHIHHRNSPASRVLLLPLPSPSWLQPSTVIYSFRISQLGLRVLLMTTGFYCYLYCYWQLRYWKGHINYSHVPTRRHNNFVGMFSQPHPTQVLPPNMLYKGSSRFH